MPMDRDPEAVEIQYLKDYTQLAGKQVIEIGCGAGSLTGQYAAAAQSTLALDPDLDAVQSAPHIQAAHLAHAQAENLPAADQSFDVAIFSSSL